MICIPAITVLLALASTSLAAVAIGPAPVNPEYPGMCWMPNQNRAYEVGAQWQEPNCVRASCLVYRSNVFVEYATCGAVAGGPGCHTEQNLKLPYPSCCPVITCFGSDPADLSGDEYHQFTNWIGEYFDHQTSTA